MDKNKQTVLFLCAHNAARSQMAEALLRHHAGGQFEVLSAGLEPTEVHPLTRQVIEERGMSAAGLRAKGVDEFLGKWTINYAIIVCARTQESCPRVYPFALQTLYWPFDDPASAPETSRLQAFRAARDLIEARLLSWLTEIREPVRRA